MKHTSEIVLRALLMGHKIDIPLIKVGKNTFDPITVALSEEHDVCMVGSKNDDGEVLLPIDLDLADFLRACDRMSEEDRVAIVCNLTLQRAAENRGSRGAAF